MSIELKEEGRKTRDSVSSTGNKYNSPEPPNRKKAIVAGLSDWGGREGAKAER